VAWKVRVGCAAGFYIVESEVEAVGLDGLGVGRGGGRCGGVEVAVRRGGRG